MTRNLVVTFAFASATYLALCAYYFLVQRTIVFPGAPAADPGVPTVEVRFEVPGATLSGHVINPDGPIDVVYFGGNAEAVEWNASRFASMPRARTLLVAYRGYGRSSGTPSQAALVDDAVRVVREFRAGRSAPLVLVGHSLGSGVAALATARMNGAVDALVLVSPFCSLTRIAAHHFPWLPIRLLLRDPFDVAAVATALPQRVTIVIAVDDRIVPAAESHRLAQTLETPPIVHELARADHNDVLDRAATWQAIAAVVDALAPAGE